MASSEVSMAALVTLPIYSDKEQTYAISYAVGNSTTFHTFGNKFFKKEDLAEATLYHDHHMTTSWLSHDNTTITQ